MTVSSSHSATQGSCSGSLGYTLGIFGAAGSMILWGASATIGLLQAWIYSEPATMFGHRSGGISLYAHEGWRKYTTLVGPLSAFGYWIGWSVVLSIFGKVIGDLATAQWWPNSHLAIGFLGNTLTLSSFIAIGCIVFVWGFNIFGLRSAVWFTYACAALLMVPLVLFIDRPVLHRRLARPPTSTRASPVRGAGLKLAIVYMFILAWSTYGTEACARSRLSTSRSTRHQPRAAQRRDVHAADLRPAAARSRRRHRSRPGFVGRGRVLHDRDEHDRGHGAAASSRSASSPACCCR